MCWCLNVAPHLPVFNCMFHEFHGALHAFHSKCQINFTNTTTSSRKHIWQKLGREDASHQATRDHEWSRKCITCPKAVDLRFFKVNSQGSTAITTKISQKKKKTCAPKIEIWRMTSWWFQPIWKLCSSNWVHLPQIGMKINNIWNHQPDCLILTDFSPPKQRLEAKPSSTKKSANNQPSQAHLGSFFRPALGWQMSAHTNPAAAKTHRLVPYDQGWAYENHWFPSIRPAIKPLFLVRFSRFCWEFFVHQLVEKKHDVFFWRVLVMWTASMF